jgi:diguanylate cyclase (GGDEF)-like protein
MSTPRDEPPAPAAPEGPSVPPAAGVPGPDRYYATRLRQLAHLELDEAEAAELWQSVARHRRELEQRLGRDVGQRVALLDYIVNLRPHLEDPQIIDRADLKRIQQNAVADALTGLYNRHYFDAELAREVERCRRYGANSSLVLLDLDRFKEVNDTHGHQAGDAVLRRVGGVILEHVRAPDVPCRYGGDEFAIILPDTPQEEALVVGERIRQAIDEAFADSPVAGLRLPVTASGGVASMGAESSSAEALLAWADRALYGAKRRISDPRAGTAQRDEPAPWRGLPSVL